MGFTLLIYRLIFIPKILVFAIAETEATFGFRKPKPRQKPKPDLVDTAINAGSFTTLVSIVSELGLVDTLRNVRKATVFAPSDDAFAKIPVEVLDSLSLEDKRKIVARHVIPGEVIPINTGVKKTTLGEEEVEFVVSVKGGDSTVKVVTPNIYARNGVIHVIDTVIL